MKIRTYMLRGGNAKAPCNATKNADKAFMCEMVRLAVLAVLIFAMLAGLYITAELEETKIEEFKKELEWKYAGF